MNSVLGILYVERKTSGHGFQCDVLLQVIGKKHLVDVRIPGGKFCFRSCDTGGVKTTSYEPNFIVSFRLK